MCIALALLILLVNVYWIYNYIYLDVCCSACQVYDIECSSRMQLLLWIILFLDAFYLISIMKYWKDEKKSEAWLG